MSKRKTKVMSVTISAGTFPNYEAAVKEANAIKAWLVRLCKNKGYSCKCIIGVSKHNPNTGSVGTKKSGGKGRPATTFVRRPTPYLTSSKPSEVEAHIHMILYCNPAATIVKALTDHLNKKYGKNVCWVKDCTDYTRNAVHYAIKQSLKVRTVDYDRQDILAADEWGFCEAVDEALDEYRNAAVSFTKSEVPSESEILENTALSDTLQEEKELICNKKYIVPTYIMNSMYKVYRLYILLQERMERYITNIPTLYIHSFNKNVPP